MSVDQATVKLAGELNSILQWIEQLNEVDVSTVEPLTSVVSMKMKMRADVVTDGHYPHKIVANAPAQEDSFFMVPKVVE
jgi:aspartyl-tRNA(Asn)/glutamyl-tRNA(Gln) amidotransferase subunit C